VCPGHGPSGYHEVELIEQVIFSVIIYQPLGSFIQFFAGVNETEDGIFLYSFTQHQQLSTKVNEK
jgi:hypothetical protein